MASAEQMAAYTAQLLANTPESSLNRPVTEVCVFKLQPQFASDHAAAEARFNSDIVAQCRPGSPHAKGIRRISWGFSAEDPAAFVWMLDWNRIQDHWDFWQTAGFPPVIGAITALFAAGRPLVRHYDFGEPGMLDAGFAVTRAVIWDDGEEGKQKQRGREVVSGTGRAKQSRGGYAVDMGEATWWCTLLGYENEADAREDTVNAPEGAVSHIFHLTYA